MLPSPTRHQDIYRAASNSYNLCLSTSNMICFSTFVHVWFGQTIRQTELLLFFPAPTMLWLGTTAEGKGSSLLCPAWGEGVVESGRQPFTRSIAHVAIGRLSSAVGFSTTVGTFFSFASASAMLLQSSSSFFCFFDYYY